MKRRARRYAWIMGVCLVLFAGSGPVAYFFGTGWAIAMCAVAAVLPPIAVTIANIRDPDDPEDR